jgi:hypothetical protein
LHPSNVGQGIRQVLHGALLLLLPLLLPLLLLTAFCHRISYLLRSL